jgi:hypothetical protein
MNINLVKKVSDGGEDKTRPIYLKEEVPTKQNG